MLEMNSRYLNPINIKHQWINKHHTSQDLPIYVLGVAKDYYNDRQEKDIQYQFLPFGAEEGEKSTDGNIYL